MIDRMKTRGERLKARRLELKMTLKQVAQSVGISLPGVQNLERGDVMPSLEIGLALAKCLRKPVQWILFGTESDPDRVPVIGTTESGPDSDWQPGEPANTERFLPFVSQRKPFMRSLSGTRFSTTISRVTSSWLTQLSRQFG
ncbi:helix-turn-helix domain-containing protein [Klebsiella pneumoniae]|uniref:helix-turn-helix domain-containing protein n=1 Tax=Klebsiella pneumoniae TaxID=573 RepID=UPI001D0D8CD5|nr:helix-turn-helix transcriptional regulator [Klebsiella pneumoniae]